MNSCLDVIKNLLIFIITIGIIPICLVEFIFRDESEIFFPKICITLIILGLVIWYFSDETPDDTENIFFDERNKSYNQKYYDMKNKSYCIQYDMNTYAQLSKNNTELEKNKLYETNEFREMYLEKGDDLKNWNWQSRERMQREINS